MPIYIIPKSMEIKDAVEPAKAAGCEQISYDIPPELVGSITQADLPIVYTLPIYQPFPPLCTHWARIDSFDVGAEKPMRVKRSWNSYEYQVDCYVTETIKDQFLAGDIAVGDFVLVEFLEDRADRAVAFAKIFKTW